MSAHHSAAQRFNSATALASTVLMLVLALVSCTSFLLIPNSIKEASLKPTHLNVLMGRSGYERNPKLREFAFVKYDLKADLSPLFNWNTKQVFVYLVADYSTSKHPTNSVVLWDRIIRNKKFSKINLAEGKQKYEFKEIGETFSNVSATFSLRYQIQPWVGQLSEGEIVRTDQAYTFPNVQRRVQG